MSLATFNYTITALTTETCSGILTSGDVSSVSWQINGDSAFDRCYVAIRPLNDLVTNGAIVAGKPGVGACTQRALLILWLLPQVNASHADKEPLHSRFPNVLRTRLSS